MLSLQKANIALYNYNTMNNVIESKKKPDKALEYKFLVPFLQIAMIVRIVAGHSNLCFFFFLNHFQPCTNYTEI